MNKLNSFLFLFGIIATISMLSSASAVTKDVAYILEDGVQTSSKITSILNSMQLSYDIIRDSELPTADLSGYYMLLITEDLGNKDFIDFDSRHAIFLDREIAEEVWPEVETIFTTNAREIKIVDQQSEIFEGVTVPADGIIQVYPGSGSEMHALRVKPSYVQSLAIRTTANRPVIASSVRDIDGYPVRNIFFGMPDVNSWLPVNEVMFVNSLQFLMAEIDQDQDGFLFENDCNDLDPNSYPGAPEVPYDGIDQDCDGFDLLDQDQDGYCKTGYLIQNSLFQCIHETGLAGTDCADEDPVINPDHPDKTINCVNDAPEFITVPQDLQFNEGQLVSFEVEASDPEGDEIEFSIDDDRFTVNDNEFTWQTDYEDAGSYILTINVTDGEYFTQTTITLQVLESNAPPVLTQIPDLEWEEETIISLNLSEYFTDSDSPELEFGIEEFSNESKIEVEFETFETVAFTPEQDFFGVETITFYAEDEDSKTISNEVTLTVTNINDPVYFNGTIPDFAFNEDNALENAFDLYGYFIDTDSDLAFEVHGNDNVTVEITNGMVSFYPDKDYYGTEQIYFNATDEEATVGSNVLTLTIYEQGEPPVFNPLECTTALNEDFTYNCTLSAWDFENNTINFAVASENNLSCQISGSTLFYKSADDYFGQASCTLRALDIHGYDEMTLQVTIAPINDAPRIVSQNPQPGVVHVVEGWDKTFELTATDVDSPEIFTTWYDNSVQVQNTTNASSSYILNNPTIGNYLIEAIIRDSQLQTRTSWNVVVGPIEDFTCEDVGGFVCSDGNMCGVTTLGVKDTNSCCPTQCIPSFDDANSCDLISEDVTIEIEEFEDDLRLGDETTVEFTITNDLDEEMDLEIELHLYNMDSDKSEFSVETEVSIGPERSRIVRLDLEIPEELDLENDEFKVFVKAEDEVCSQNYKNIEIERKEVSVQITEFDLPTSAFCGEPITAEVEIENQGTDDQQVTLNIKNSDLEFEEQVLIDLDEYAGENDKEKKEFSFEIPNDLETGEYEVRARIDYGENKFETLSKTIYVECIKEQVRSSSRVPTIIQDKITLNQLEESTGQQLEEEKPNYMPLAILGTLNIIMIGSVVILYLFYKKKS